LDAIEYQPAGGVVVNVDDDVSLHPERAMQKRAAEQVRKRM
jgi:hypothetical protein